uniref:Uncharacterized protein n=1 Tax=Arundo donax TaxID=35708 RepID=A0A0A8YT24_ARUDO
MGQNMKKQIGRRVTTLNHTKPQTSPVKYSKYKRSL